MSVISALTSAWGALTTYIIDLFGSVQSLFWTTTETGGQFTLIGAFAAIMAGVSIMLLVFNLIRSFFVARG